MNTTDTTAPPLAAAVGSAIYLASRYSRAPQLRELREALQRMGYQVTSRWIDGGHELSKEGSTQAAHMERMRFATEDWEDMLAADVVVSITEEPRKTTTRGGRHVEFGGAVALGKRLVVIGHRENVFHCLPQVEFYESHWDWLRAWQQPKENVANPTTPGACIDGCFELRVVDAGSYRVCQGCGMIYEKEPNIEMSQPEG